MSDGTCIAIRRAPPCAAWLVALFALLLCTAAPCAAQCCRVSFPGDELVIGGSANVLLRGPWMSAAWRRPLPRLAVFALGSFAYERYFDQSGWEWRDFNQRLAGYVATEAIVTGVRWLRRRLGGPRQEPRRAARGFLILRGAPGLDATEEVSHPPP